MNYKLIPIGKFEVTPNDAFIEIFPEYRKAMEGLEEFSYLQIIWWFDKCDNDESRSKLIEEKPYKKGPSMLGTFATRSPQRPNPIAVSTVYVLSVDMENGKIHIPYTDAFSETPILDIKPYMPSVDRVETVQMPKWCEHWPSNIETSRDFDWASEFNF